MQSIKVPAKLEQALFLWYQGQETRGAAATGDLLTQKAKLLASHRVLFKFEIFFVTKIDNFVQA
jgi:hypothetical protein